LNKVAPQDRCHDREINMSAYSIYQKPCPACGMVVSTSIKRCDCGYTFGYSDETALLPEEQALQEEELFEAYLAARVGQTVAKVESVRTELAADPANLRKADHLLEAVQEALILRDERDAQAAKTAQALKAAQAARGKITPVPDVPVQSDRPTEAFRTQQATKAEKIVEAFTNTETKKCPHCNTVLPVTSALCFCGYNFSRHDFMLPRGVDNSLGGESSRSK
jgi:predicted nucleic acid-binding Zn ribbon protein